MANNIVSCCVAFVVTVLFCAVTPLFAASGKVTLDNADIVGAGATFPNPLYQRWIKEFAKTGAAYSIFYDAVGSGDGVKRFMAGTVDFGASDSAMTDDQMAEVPGGVQLIPATAGIIVLAYNLPNTVGELRLNREVYADIFLGRIRSWDDERIKALNPQLKLPRLSIVTCTRSDSSGTTWAFTNHLSAVSGQWRDQGPGTGKKVDWPGNSMAGRYNEGVATKIRHSWGSIGYVEYGVAKRAGLAMASLENKAGHFVRPHDASGTTTLANTVGQLPANLRMFLPDPDGQDSWPIITYSWLLLNKTGADTQKAGRVREFVRWGLTSGQQYAQEHGFAPLPAGVTSAALQALDALR